MTNQFSPLVSEVLAYSREEAARLSCSIVRPEHLMLAILRERKNPMTGIFTDLNINVHELKQNLESLSSTESESHDAIQANNVTSLDDKTNNILKLSVLEARLAHSQTVNIEHLVLAILHDNASNGVKAALGKYGINYELAMKYLLKPNSKTTVDGIGLSEEEDENMTGRNSRRGDSSSSAGTADMSRTSGKTGTPVLDKFSTDLTKAALDGKLDPVVGRTNEMQRVTEVLCRRKKNNPILIGEPGVGKSAIAEGLAQQIASRHTSPLLFNKRILRLDMTSIVAGTKYRGQFEERIQALLRELEDNPDIIVFIDEIHTIVGAGSTPGSMDAANIMKPALARGLIQCIGATTLDEYRNSIEKDGALERRFQRVMVEPSTAEETLEILHNIKERYEDHHHVRYTDDALKACADLTGRYITERQYPDKAIDALDEVGSRVHLQHAVIPPAIIDKEKEIRQTEQLKNAAAADQNFELAASYRDRQCQLEAELKKLNEEWATGDDGQRETVDSADVANVVSTMTGIPLQRISEKESDRLRRLGECLNNSVIAQEKAINKVVRSIQRNRLGLGSPNRPIGVFMFLGPTGVGKTYLAQRLAEEMFGTKDAMIRIDMSEYSEKFNTSRLVGAPPGYVGYGEGGQLTERVRRHPYSIVLLDEIEKAHGDVFNLLLQVLDEGRMTDGNGRIVDFRNTIIIMTSNAGTRQLKDFSHGIGFNAISINGAANEQSKEYARSIIQKALSRQFAPEFLNRLDEIITFDQLDAKAIRRIVDVELDKFIKRISKNGYAVTVTDAAKTFLATKGYDPQFGARPLKRAIQTYVKDEICEKILFGEINAGDAIVVDKKSDEEKLTVEKANKE
ncbi:ATP-dependent Clp protease ATP-binding subunit [uncultured Prevotella sp.]|uniref:ATP-dependent Clp protease ATP-binding subunit n=1 Tax=uncultured Prevotella sp. TaxID=159272 RepID=UPI0025F1FCBE|nr:ATP-dependent Clp protease ATP-binding subunit [uncultured Prevotella sp.]